MDFAQMMFAQPPQGGAVVPAVAPAQPQAAAPAGLMERLRTDPALSQAMLMAGARLMQGRRPGQDDFGMLADAGMVGLSAHNISQYNRQVQEQQAEQQAQAAALNQARIAQANAGTARVEQETGFAAEDRPLAREKLAEAVKQLRTGNRKEEADALIAEYRAGNIKTQTDLDNSLRRAQIGQAQASAGASQAQTENTRFRNQAMMELLDEGDPLAALHGRRTGAGAAKEKLAEMRTYLEKAYPQAGEQEISKMIVDMQTGKKGENLEMLVRLTESMDPKIRTWAEGELANRAGYPQGGSPAPKGRKAAPALTWEQARSSVPIGGTYIGPDGKSYVRNN